MGENRDCRFGAAHPMKINILLNASNHSWIIQKMATRLQEELAPLGTQATVTDRPDPSAEVVHHMSWAFANVRTPQPSTMFITHLDDSHKLRQVRRTLDDEVKVGICISRDTMEQLVAHGCRPGSLTFVPPAHDGAAAPRRIVIGITSRVYADGRKREAVLQAVAARMDLSAFRFEIFGAGWEPTVKLLEAAGAAVSCHGETDDYRRDYDALIAAVPHFDYYLYLGMDEGSLGTLDALAAGVRTIVTPQGFHLDVPGGITHPVVSEDDLARVFGQLAAPIRQRAASVAGLTWAAYARRHLGVWQALAAGQPLPEPPLTAPEETPEREAARTLRQQTISANAWNPRRIVSSLSHSPGLKRLRRAVDQVRFARR